MIAFSCNKHGNDKSNTVFERNNHENFAIPFDVHAKSLSGGYIWNVRTSHNAEGCNGCVTSGGHTYHIDCMGVGNACTESTSVVLSPVTAAQYQAFTLNKYELTPDDLFLMPARSLYIVHEGEEDIWLNIPEQLAYRDSVTGQFIFDELFFADHPAYDNQ